MKVVKEKQNEEIAYLSYRIKLLGKKKQSKPILCLGFEGLKVGHEDIYSLIILNNILGGSMSSRLFQEVREQRGLAYSVFSYHSAFQDSGIVTVYGGTGAKQLDVLFETIQETLDDLKTRWDYGKRINK